MLLHGPGRLVGKAQTEPSKPTHGTESLGRLQALVCRIICIHHFKTTPCPVYEGPAVCFEPNLQPHPVKQPIEISPIGPSFLLRTGQVLVARQLPQPFFSIAGNPFPMNKRRYLGPNPQPKRGYMQGKARGAQNTFDHMVLVDDQAVVLLHAKQLAGNVAMSHVDHVGGTQELDDARAHVLPPGLPLAEAQVQPRTQLRNAGALEEDHPADAPPELRLAGHVQVREAGDVGAQGVAREVDVVPPAPRGDRLHDAVQVPDELHEVGVDAAEGHVEVGLEVLGRDNSPADSKNAGAVAEALVHVHSHVSGLELLSPHPEPAFDHVDLPRLDSEGGRRPGGLLLVHAERECGELLVGHSQGRQVAHA
mmetsp:Transcript_120808/g.352896  ORF Transcript_120808/g.352896 Transcript_120808/m.352896 type:complete len:364 (-) Transcript_120808:108-1199(-)